MNELPSGGVLQLAAMLTLVSLAPALVLACTTFARFIIVFSMLKTGLGAGAAPPSQVLVGLALFMTAFVMAPTGGEIHQRAIEPYLAGRITELQALEQATPPLRRFLLERTKERDLALFYEVSNSPRPESEDQVPLRIAVPSFAVSELRTAFEMGFLILLPFLVIDLIVASVLSALGMVMLPPTVVALPIKLLVFVAVDGWHLLVQSLLRGALG
ncbi:MAG: flagellar type III secretion system pore protein FliP [Deltaproteobacteria bacterium]|nr:flagellar type III secretion system pore protein FliP [Deltaproteobacteria bacterium]